MAVEQKRKKAFFCKNALQLAVNKHHTCYQIQDRDCFISHIEKYVLIYVQYAQNRHKILISGGMKWKKS